MTDEEVRAAITDNLLDYCAFLDEKRLDDWAALFTEDVVFDEGGTTEGRAALRTKVLGLLRKFKGLSHHLSNIRVTRTGPGTATSVSYIYAWHELRDGSPMELWGRYVDEHRLEGGRWKIARRTVMVQGGRGTKEIRILRVPQQELPSA
jgi:3-phenylpropionate/cinnamic acid dioxygenase small subunit